MKKLFIILSVLIVVVGCGEEKSDYPLLHEWFEATKKEILINAEIENDSINYIIENNHLSITYFSNEKKIRHEYRTLDTSLIFALTLYGENELFELRNEVYKNGQKRMEGIVYKNEFYGPWNRWDEKGESILKGYRYENIDFGKWTYYNEFGEVDEVLDKGQNNLVDSILNNENLKTTKLK